MIARFAREVLYKVYQQVLNRNLAKNLKNSRTAKISESLFTLYYISLQFDEFFCGENIQILISCKSEIFTLISHLKLVETPNKISVRWH